jgi:rubredoxin
MTWNCPACGTSIHHVEDIPNPAVTYRCQVCRLELRVNNDTGKMVVVPLTAAADDKTPPVARRRRRAKSG